VSGRSVGRIDEAGWERLRSSVGNRLLGVEPSLAPCLDDPTGAACAAVLELHRNPFFLEEHPGATQTTGWFGAHAGGAGPYCVAAESDADLAAAIAFANQEDVRVVVKGTGHDYLGRSSDPDALLLWTHRMRDIAVHDSFVPVGSDWPRVPAITVGAGVRWLEAYQALLGTGRYVNGGGCTTVGAAGGFTQGGGYASFSRTFGTAAGNVLELEVVTADGEILVANPYRNPDLFWALRGGGGGTFGIVSKVTFRTHPVPETIGALFGTITTSDDRAYRQLVQAVVYLLPALCDRHWGEQIRFGTDNTLVLTLTTLDLTDDGARSAWRPVLDWVDARPGSFTTDVIAASGPFEPFWDRHRWDELAPAMICRDERPGQPDGRFWWSTNQGEVSQYVNAYQSRWLPIGFAEQAPDVAAEVLFEASRHCDFGIHLNKGLAGAAPDALARDRTTSINPAVFDAVGLVIIASLQQFAYPGLPGHGPDSATAEAGARAVTAAMAPLRAATPGSGAYVNEADYFEPDWQASFWGANYPRLLEIKRRVDPANRFCVHHGVGSDNPG
jgi:FAD/FMN-containing dehydrogenase